MPAKLLRREEAGDSPPDGAQEPSSALGGAAIEARAMRVVMEREHRLGYESHDVSSEKRGYDIESRDPGTGGLRFIEVRVGVLTHRPSR